jgi:drug/metabolite transporter (DMT)-like permease
MQAPDTKKRPRMGDSAKAAVLMVFSMLLYASENTIVKGLTGVLPLWQILMTTSGGGMLIFAVITKARGIPIFTPAMLSPTVLLRSIGEILAAFGFILAMAFLPLTTFSAILQAQPMIVTFGAVVFLRERISWRRWLALIGGFCGVLLIVRPTTAAFDPYVLFALISAVGLALRDLVSRQLVREIHTVQLSTWGLGTVLGSGLLLMPFGAPAQMPTPIMALSLGLVFTISALAYYAITASTRLAPASFVAPFRYTRLLFALALGGLVFGEVPDLPTLLGAGIIILSGLYTLSFGPQR